MSKDGFASLSGTMLVRTRSLPRAATSLEPDRAELRASHHAPITHPDVPMPPDQPAESSSNPVAKETLRERRRVISNGASHPPATHASGRPVPPSDRLFYTGPERRSVDISPLVERRHSAPPRVKVSVRLETYRYKRLKNASDELGRTHQDLMTCALDHYLDLLRIAQVDPKARHCS